ncbi:MAG: sugar ABC transporter permease [Ruminococcus flavefaciens]|nr:sugar ABC transporter permease [Ruminococcus flavefaciens]
MEKKKITGWLFVIPSLIGVSFFYLIPFFDVVRRSFMQAVGDGFAGLNNYKQVLTNEAFILAAGNTLRFVIICIPLLVVISLWIAVLLQSQKNGKNFFKSAYLIPLAIPASSVVLLWKLVFDNNGMLNGVLSFFKIKGIDWMNTGASFWVLVFSYIWKNLGYGVVLWLAGLNGIPESIYEAASVDGAGSIKTFFYITLPNLRPVAFTIVILSFLNSFKVFREAYLVSGNYPHEKIYLLQHLFNNWFLDLSVDKMAAGSVMLCSILIIFVLLLQKSWDR